MLSPTVLIGFFVFITGLCIGSFLNVVILRALSGESIVFPASKCPKCQTPLKWWHNIPVISYIFLKGKCAFCHDKISIQYPIIEFLTAYLFLATFLHFGYSMNTIFTIIFICLFIVISTTDIKEHVSFDLHSYILGFFGVIYNFFNFGHLYQGHTFIFNTSFVASILGIILGAGLIAIYFGLGYLLFKTMIIGPGDIFITGALGACFGWKYILLIIVGAIAIQILMFIPFFVQKLWIKKQFLTLNLFIAFIVMTTILFIYKIYFDYNLIIYWTLTGILAIIGIILCKKIIDSLPENLVELNEQMINSEEVKTTDENGEIFHMPFGPALCTAAIFFIFLH